MILSLIERARKDGVSVMLAPSGSIKARGKQEIVNRWLPAIRKHKAAIVEQLRKETGTPITREEEQEIRSWLAHIGETDPESIGIVFELCRTNPCALAAFLESAKEAPRIVTRPERVRCGDCGQFQPDSTGDGSGIGDCYPIAAPVPVRYPCALRHCERFTEIDPD